MRQEEYTLFVVQLLVSIKIPAQLFYSLQQQNCVSAHGPLATYIHGSSKLESGDSKQILDENPVG